jgi:hypothetical protein
VPITTPVDTQTLEAIETEQVVTTVKPESLPVVVILHGNHPGCPIPEGDMVDRLTCEPEVERCNYPGFEYLVERLAAATIGGPNKFGVELEGRADLSRLAFIGHSQGVDEPALRFPDGYQEENDTFDGGMISGRVPLTSIRMPLSGFAGVNFAEIREILLLFDQTTSGTLFMGNIELVRSRLTISEQV